MAYDNDLNHQQWLETVPDSLRRFVSATIATWDASADDCNKWTALGWDERDELLHAQSVLENQEELL